jgi:hypothetical protein
MKGYAFIDMDFNLQYRTAEFIEVDNPFFWQQNKDFILRKWKFDTEDLSSMYFMFNQLREIFKGQNASATTVENFCTMIDFNTKLLKDANKV